MHIGIKGLIQSGGKRVGNATIKVMNMPSGSPIKHDVLSGKIDGEKEALQKIKRRECVLNQFQHIAHHASR